MPNNHLLAFVGATLENMPADWLHLTTHRLDVYEEESAKTQFLERFEALYRADDASPAALAALPTAFDYIRLGHPLSCLLEWVVAKSVNSDAERLISFSSTTMPVLAILRTNKLRGSNTRIVVTDRLPEHFDPVVLRDVYGYRFELVHEKEEGKLDSFEGSVIRLVQTSELPSFTSVEGCNFQVNFNERLGSMILIGVEEGGFYVSEVQHVRRRESIAMTPADCYQLLSNIVDPAAADQTTDRAANQASVETALKSITGTKTVPLLGSSGLSIQYAIMMGLIDDAKENHSGKAIKIIVPPNCYGGTNDQARRVAAAIDRVTIVDLPVDGDREMVESVEQVLNQLAEEDAVPYIIAEIPTNPRVEVPNLTDLRDALNRNRYTPSGDPAISPVFILDQTFCPNVRFLGDEGVLSSVRTISYSSGSKFPSGGLCTAGYCVGSEGAEGLLSKIQLHLQLCDNEATDFQVEILAGQLPSMLERIEAAYRNCRDFVDFISETLPTAKINFVSQALAEEGFTPSVFSLDLPTAGENDAEREAHKRALNYRLINSMIEQIPESKFCVSYGQLKGCYWTIPATSTQGTTKEGDKDYIVRASVSPDLDLESHKKVFARFAEELTVEA